MKHKLTYSLLLSLVVLLSFDLAIAQIVSVVGDDTDLHPNTQYCYDVVLDDGTGITAFTLPITITGAGFVSGTVTATDGVATALLVGDEVLVGYSGADLGAGPHTLATICVTTGAVCGETFEIATGVMAPAGGPMFAGGVGCAVATTFAGLTGTLYNGTPVCGTNSDENLGCGGDIVDKQIDASDPIGLALTYDVITGPGSVDAAGLYNYTPPADACDFTELVEVLVTNPCGNSATCSFTINYDQDAPVVTCPGAQTEHWSAGPQVYTASATDDGCPNPPGAVEYTIVDVVPATTIPVTIVTTTGEITFDPDCGDVGNGPFVITIMANDGCETDVCDFTADVTNTPPTITCPGDVASWYSYMGNMVLPFTAADAEDPITVTILETLKDGVPTAPIQPMMITGTYNFEWDPEWLDEGDWVVTLEVSDGCQTAICSFNIHVVGKFFLCIDSTSVLPGHQATVTLNVTNSMPVGGFDLLISYDQTINFLGAVPVGIVADWEYFTFRTSQFDNCGGGCPTGILRLIGIANMPDGVFPDESVFHPEGGIVELTFGTPEDLSYIGQCFHLSWIWFDCGDNTMSSRSGDTLFMAQGIDGILPESGCTDGFKGYEPEAKINFCDGIICIVPPEDDRGDINLNGVANEISDAVMYANYFIYGPEVLGYGIDSFYDNRVLASDVNDDGTPLTVADLVYLIRIITGDANPYPESGEGGKLAPFANAIDVGYVVGDQMIVNVSSAVEIGAASFIFRHTGEVGTPVLADNAGQMTVRSSDQDGELRVLVYSMDNNSIESGVNELFSVPLNGQSNIELVEVQFSDALGSQLAVNTNKVEPPKSFELSQNYPNPFNAGTVIKFALATGSDWNLRIYNVAGQLVDEFKGYSDAGYVSLHWNPEDAASGIYFYKLNTKNFSDTKKMILMK